MQDSSGLIADVRNLIQKLSLAYENNFSTYSTALESIREKIIVGPGQFYYLVDTLSTEMVYVSPQVVQVLGYVPQEMNVSFFYNHIHPEDKKIVFEAVSMVYEFLFRERAEPLKSGYQITYRVRHREGHYLRILRHSLVLEVNESGQPLLHLSFCTDISLVKKENQVGVNFFMENGEKLYADFLHKFFKILKKLSQRELEIIQLLAQGKNSKEIANALFIAKNTVDTHRRKILKKTNTRTTYELIALAHKMGWI